MNEKELYVVKEFKFDKPLITKIDSIIDNCYRECHNKYYHTFEYECEYDIKLTSIRKNENVNLTFVDISIDLFKLTVGQQKDFIFNQINKLTIKIYSHLRYINISYYLKFLIPMSHRRFFKVISQNRDYVDYFAMIQIIHFMLHVRSGSIN